MEKGRSSRQLRPCLPSELQQRRQRRLGWRRACLQQSYSGLRRRLTAGLFVLAQLKGDRLLLLLLVELKVERPLRRRDALRPSGSAAAVVEIDLSSRMNCPAMAAGERELEPRELALHRVDHRVICWRQRSA